MYIMRTGEPENEAVPSPCLGWKMKVTWFSYKESLTIIVEVSFDLFEEL